MPPRILGLVLVLIGGALLVAGLLVSSGALSWFGRLPGDIHLRADGYAFYLPLASMLLVSLVLCLLLVLFRRLF